jgi:hypothetical protein
MHNAKCRIQNALEFIHSAFCILHYAFTKGPPSSRPGLSISKPEDLKIVCTNSAASVGLSTLLSSLYETLDLSAESVREVTRSHHTETLKEILNLRSNYVTHRKRGKEM